MTTKILNLILYPLKKLISSYLSLRKVLRRKLIEAKYSNFASNTSFDWNWEDKGYNRIALVNYLVSRTNGFKTKYLEIGCAHNTLFHSVASGCKDGVDPLKGGTHRMTSSEFFRTNKSKYDVIFIDGLHEYSQLREDIINALNVIEDNGWIAMHDLLPRTWQEQHVPRIQEAWTGDCWKVAVELSQATGVEFKIVNIDHGVGVLRKTEDTFLVPDLSYELLNANFDNFVSRLENLEIIDFEQAIKEIESITA